MTSVVHELVVYITIGDNYARSFIGSITLHTSPSRLFGAIHGNICGSDQICPAVGIVRIGCNTKACCQRNELPRRKQRGICNFS